MKTQKRKEIDIAELEQRYLLAKKAFNEEKTSIAIQLLENLIIDSAFCTPYTERGQLVEKSYDLIFECILVKRKFVTEKIRQKQYDTALLLLSNLMRIIQSLEVNLGHNYTLGHLFNLYHSVYKQMSDDSFVLNIITQMKKLIINKKFETVLKKYDLIEINSSEIEKLLDLSGQLYEIQKENIPNSLKENLYYEICCDEGYKDIAESINLKNNDPIVKRK